MFQWPNLSGVGVKRAVVDTNVIVSAFIAGGAPQRVIQAWITGGFQAVISKELRDEVNLVLKRTKIIKFDSKRRVLLGTLFNQALMVLPQPLDAIVFPDPDDHFLLELAITAQASFIVTRRKFDQKSGL